MVLQRLRPRLPRPLLRPSPRNPRRLRRTALRIFGPRRREVARHVRARGHQEASPRAAVPRGEKERAVLAQAAGLVVLRRVGVARCAAGLLARLAMVEGAVLALVSFVVV